MVEEKHLSLNDWTLTRLLVEDKLSGWSSEYDAALKEACETHRGSDETSDEVVDEMWRIIGTFKGSRPEGAGWKHTKARENLRKLIEKHRTLFDSLIDLPEEELRRRYAEAVRRRRAFSKQFQLKLEQRLFFNLPHADADFDEWNSKEFWTVDEATALSFGKDPRIVSWNAIADIPRSPWVQAYKRRHDALDAYLKTHKQLSYLNRKTFQSVAKVLGISDQVPEGLDFANPKRKASQPEDEELHHRERHIFYNVLLTWAMHHGFDPSNYHAESNGSTAFTSMERKLADIGLDVGVQTLRKHTVLASRWATEKRGIKLKMPDR